MLYLYIMNAQCLRDTFQEGVGASKYLNLHYEYANIFSRGFFYYIYYMYIKSSTQITISYIDTCTISSTGISSITVQVGIKHHYQCVNCIYQLRIVSSSITRWNINHIKVIVIDFALILPWNRCGSGSNHTGLTP